LRIVSFNESRGVRRSAVLGEHRYLPPRSFETFVARTEAFNQLREGLGKVTVLVGPPGSGKTTLLAEYYAQLDASAEQVHWLSLSSEDNDPQVLQRHLLKAFSLESPASGDDQPDVPGNVAGFIDGVEFITDPVAHELLEWFVLSLPVSSCLYLTTTRLRGRLLHAARLRGIVHVLGPQVMRMSNDEARTLLGTEWSAWEVESLNRYVDGWAAGLRFMQRSPEVCRRLLARIDASPLLPAQMCDYFEEEISASLPEATLEALTELSVFERFIPELVLAVPAARYGWELIDEQIRNGLFIRYLDERRYWAEVHPAFGAFLRQRLQRLNPSRFDELKQFVAMWLKANGYTAEAVRHAVHISEPGIAAQIIEESGAIAVDLGETADIVLEYIPATQAGNLPLLFISQLYHRIRNGRLSSARLVFDEAWRLTDGFTRVVAEVNPQILACWAHLCQLLFLTIDDVPYSEATLLRLNEDFQRNLNGEPTLVAGLSSVLAFGYLDAWRYEEVVSACNMGLRIQEGCNENKVTAFLQIHKACAVLALDSLPQAIACAEEAVRLAYLDGSYGSYEVLSSHFIRGALYYENHQPDLARQMLLPALEQIRQVNGWVYLYTEAYSAAIASVGIDEGFSAAERLISEGEQFARERGLKRLLQCLNVCRLNELIRAKKWREAMALVEAEPMVAQLQVAGTSAYELSTLIPAVLSVASLMLELSRPRDAIGYLERLQPLMEDKFDCRLRFGFHLMFMRAAFAMRRYNAAFEHMHSALQIGCSSGLSIRLHEAKEPLLDVYGWARGQGKQIAPQLNDWIETTWGPRLDTGKALAGKSEATNCVLSPRESEIIGLIAEGYINKEIAAKLGITEGTVKGYRKKIREKLGVTSRSKALSKARELLII
jgi:LuxR family maltose regulon positive regulatory protein